MTRATAVVVGTAIIHRRQRPSLSFRLRRTSPPALPVQGSESLHFLHPLHFFTLYSASIFPDDPNLQLELHLHLLPDLALHQINEGHDIRRRRPPQVDDEVSVFRRDAGTPDPHALEPRLLHEAARILPRWILEYGACRSPLHRLSPIPLDEVR